MSKNEKTNTQGATILVVDDSHDTLELISRNLEYLGHTVFTSDSVPQALDIIETVLPEIVITDWKMPVYNGLDLVKYIHNQQPGLGLMMITGHASIESAIQAVKNGVEEYLPKPFTDEELAAAIDKMIDHVRKRKILSQKDIEAISRYGLVGNTPGMLEVFNLIKKAALSNASVLVTGESGTGKELVARAIHYQSTHSKAPFVAVNCSAIPHELIESELFGYVRGAFTGAHTSREGLFQAAEGGTIFLDEVSEMNPDVQVKLLRVLQEKEVTPVGARKPIKVNTHIIAASNKVLKKMVELGSFREDLYYRLNIIGINIPPLRERKEDLPFLISIFSTRFSAEAGKNLPQFADSTLDLLHEYEYPGNVRELENIIQQLVVVSDTVIIQPSDLPSYLRTSNIKRGDQNLKSLAQVEAEHMHNVVSATRGNITKAAAILGIDRKTLRSKLKEIQET